jgi:DNA-binding response OmpR family regulator
MIDDDESLVGIMAIKLKHSGYLVDTAVKSTQGYAMASTQPYDVVILDVTMPGLNGFDICKNLRAQGVLTPILMLSGKTDKPDIIRSLELGADDYLTKPFNHTELVARLKALVRRNNRTFPARWVNGCGLELDIINSKATYGESSVILTKKETLLLRRLMNESPEATSREILLKDVWGIDDMHTSNRLDVYIRRLRSKLEKIDVHDLVHTQRGSGYYFGEIHQVEKVI